MGEGVDSTAMLDAVIDRAETYKEFCEMMVQSLEVALPRAGQFSRKKFEELKKLLGDEA
jgi:hypothetical protein